VEYAHPSLEPKSSAMLLVISYLALFDVFDNHVNRIVVQIGPDKEHASDVKVSRSDVVVGEFDLNVIV
jgi:hypothetical protein